MVPLTQSKMSLLKPDGKGAFLADEAAIDAAFQRDSSDMRLQEKIYGRRIAALSKPEDYLKDKLDDLIKIDAEVAGIYKDTFKTVYASTGSEEYSRNAAKDAADAARRQRLAIHNVTYPDQIVGGVGDVLRKKREAGRKTK